MYINCQYEGRPKNLLKYQKLCKADRFGVLRGSLEANGVVFITLNFHFQRLNFSKKFSLFAT